MQYLVLIWNKPGQMGSVKEKRKPMMAKHEPGPERGEVRRQLGRQGEATRKIPAEMLGRELGLSLLDLPLGDSQDPRNSFLGASTPFPS